MIDELHLSVKAEGIHKWSNALAEATAKEMVTVLATLDLLVLRVSISRQTWQ